jgi:hypothetical protein
MQEHSVDDRRLDLQLLEGRRHLLKAWSGIFRDLAFVVNRPLVEVRLACR